MCGRYVITSAPEAIRALFHYLDQPHFPPRYNIAPTQPVPIVRLAEGNRRFALVRWGLIPYWTKNPRDFTLLINARGESLDSKPAFRDAVRRRRCLFPADGFYEWKIEGDGRRPYFIRPRVGGPIAFAGLWDSWMGPNGEEMETACIVTTAANRMLAPLHERMPVVIGPEAFDLWLDCSRVDSVAAAALITPAPENLFEVYEISTAVNRVANDSAALIEPLSASIVGAHANQPAEAVARQAAAQSVPAPRGAAQAGRTPKPDSGQGELF
jgi:putative SOS response-associated peptidase YedK